MIQNIISIFFNIFINYVFRKINLDSVEINGKNRKYYRWNKRYIIVEYPVIKGKND